MADAAAERRQLRAPTGRSRRPGGGSAARRTRRRPSPRRGEQLVERAGLPHDVGVGDDDELGRWYAGRRRWRPGRSRGCRPSRRPERRSAAAASSTAVGRAVVGEYHVEGDSNTNLRGATWRRCHCSSRCISIPRSRKWSPVCGNDPRLLRSVRSWSAAAALRLDGAALYGAVRDHARQLGAVAVAMRKHAQLHPNAVMRGKPMNLDDYLASRWVSFPYRLLDCCLETDGAGALLVTIADRARDLRKKPIYVSGIASGHPYPPHDLPNRPDILKMGLVFAPHAPSRWPKRSRRIWILPRSTTVSLGR